MIKNKIIIIVSSKTTITKTTSLLSRQQTAKSEQQNPQILFNQIRRMEKKRHGEIINQWIWQELGAVNMIRRIFGTSNSPVTKSSNALPLSISRLLFDARKNIPGAATPIMTIRIRKQEKLALIGDEESDVCSESSLSSLFVLDVCGVVLIREERIPNPG